MNTELAIAVQDLCRFWWPRCLRRGSAAAGLLGLWVRIPSEAWMSFSRDCCVFWQVEVSVSGQSLVQRSPNRCGVSEGHRGIS